MPATVTWTQATARDYHLTLKRGQLQTQELIESVKSETTEDILYHDGEWYRNEIDAAFMGTARTLISHETGGLSPVDALIPNGTNDAVVAGSSGATIGFPTVNDPHLEQSDSWTGTPPHPLQKTMTKICWWGDESGTGELIGWAWLHEVYSFLPVKVTKTT